MWKSRILFSYYYICLGFVSNARINYMKRKKGKFPWEYEHHMFRRKKVRVTCTLVKSLLQTTSLIHGSICQKRLNWNFTCVDYFAVQKTSFNKSFLDNGLRSGLLFWQIHKTTTKRARKTQTSRKDNKTWSFS